MSSRLRTVGRVLLGVVEAGLAVVVLGSVAMLLELRAASAAGEGTFAVGFLFLWVVAGGSLGLLVGAHAMVVAAATMDRAGVAGLRDRFRRPVVELAGAAIVVVALVPQVLGGDPYLLALTGSAALALATIVHVAVGATLVARRLAAG